MAAQFNAVKLVKGGTITGNDKASGAGNLTSDDEWFVFGGESDLWGLELAPADVNASDFGVAVSLVGDPQRHPQLAGLNFYSRAGQSASS